MEKLLKGFLLSQGRRVPRTHSLADLGRLAREHGFPADLAIKMRMLDAYHLPTRYPDAVPRLSDLPQEKEAEEALAVATAVGGGS